MNINDFEELLINENIGKGSQGIVKLMKNKTNNKIYAVKIINKNKRNYNNETSNIEIINHKLFNSPYIIKLYFYINTKDNLYLFQEFALNKDLFRYLNNNKLEENILKKVFYQVCLGLKEIHDHNIIHRDIKPENILLDKYLNAKICDFGLSTKIIEKSSRQTFCGTLEYMSPEIILDMKYTNKTDIWSLGILLYELYHNQTPFKGKTKNDMRDIFTNKKIKIIFKKKLKSDIKKLILNMLKLNINNRPNINDILSSDFLNYKKNYSKSVFNKKNMKINLFYSKIKILNKSQIINKTRYPIYSLLKKNIKFIFNY